MQPELKTYVIRRPARWATAEELRAAAPRWSRVGDEEMADDIRWIRSYVVAEADGSVGMVCVYQASSPEKVVEHARRAGLSATDLLEVVETVLVRPDADPVPGRRPVRETVASG
jgi:hypothetical protein